MPSVIFTIEGSNRHEIIDIDTDTTASLEKITSVISQAAASSPNCAEFMAKYKKKPEEGKEEKVGEVKVRWSSAGRDSKTWPATTLLTDDNTAAALQLLDPNKDVLEVKFSDGKE